MLTMRKSCQIEELSSNSQGDRWGVDIQMAQTEDMEPVIMEILIIGLKLALIGIFLVIATTLPLYALTFLPWEDD